MNVVVIDNPKLIGLVRLRALHAVLKLEAKTGLKHSKLGSVAPTVREVLHTTIQSKTILAAELEKLIERRERAFSRLQAKHEDTADIIERRCRRLIACMKWAAVLSREEASWALYFLNQGYAPEFCGGEAVQHYGGVLEVIKSARRLHMSLYRTGIVKNAPPDQVAPAS